MTRETTTGGDWEWARLRTLTVDWTPSEPRTSTASEWLEQSPAELPDDDPYECPACWTRRLS